VKLQEKIFTLNIDGIHDSARRRGYHPDPNAHIMASSLSRDFQSNMELLIRELDAKYIQV
jgi:hypothetical protein